MVRFNINLADVLLLVCFAAVLWLNTPERAKPMQCEVQFSEQSINHLRQLVNK